MSDNYTTSPSIPAKWQYHGITHLVPFKMLAIWRRFMCQRGVHAFDEVFGQEHYLHCDACGLSAHIERFEGGSNGA